MIAKDIVQNIIDKADIVEVISGYVTLEKVGSNYRGLCPFHDDKNPSFYVSPGKKIATCMSCKEGGNVISLLQKLEKISFDQACKKLADRYGIELKITTTDKKVVENKNYYEITKYTSKYYQFYLNNSEKGKIALEYLHKRGLNDETINMFKIGLAPSEKNTLYLTLKDQNYLELDMLEVGVVKKTEVYYDLFNNRIMFPIIDENSNVVGFSGRIYYESDQPKYVNSPENAIFHKGNVLYNLNNAQDGIRKRKRIVIMEGFMDVIAAHNAGLTEAVCAMGTAFTKEHANLIKKYTKNVILCFDGDSAGMHAASRAIEILQDERLNIAIVCLPENLDPDEYIKKYGKEKFLDVFEKELLDSYTFKYRFARFGHDLDNTIESETFKIAIFRMLLQERTQTIIEKYLRMLAVDLKISLEAITTDFKTYFNKQRTLDYVEKRHETKEIQKVKNGTLTAYQTLIKYMMLNKNQAYLIYNKLDSLSEYQMKFIPNISRPKEILYLIYNFYKLNYDDAYYENYNEFIIKIMNYYNKYETMDMEQFRSDFIEGNIIYDNFYNDLLDKIKLSTQEKYIKQEINDCFTALECFILQYAMREYDEILSEIKDVDLRNEFYSKKIRIKQELDLLKKIIQKRG